WDDGWACAGCHDGGDVIALVGGAEGLDPKRDFLAIVRKLDGGPELLATPAEPADPERERQAREAREERQRGQELEQNEFRESERRRAWDLWQGRRPIFGTAAQAYLAEKRALNTQLIGEHLGFDPGARFYVQDRPQARVIHEGPALLAAIQRG